MAPCNRSTTISISGFGKHSGRERWRISRSWSSLFFETQSSQRAQSGEGSRGETQRHRVHRLEWNRLRGNGLGVIGLMYGRSLYATYLCVLCELCVSKKRPRVLRIRKKPESSFLNSGFEFCICPLRTTRLRLQFHAWRCFTSAIGSCTATRTSASSLGRRKELIRCGNLGFRPATYETKSP